MDATAVKVATTTTHKEMAGLIDWLGVFVGEGRLKPRENTPETRRQQVGKVEREDITKANVASCGTPR